jgi:DNA-binding IclR family transcriptional regulator
VIATIDDSELLQQLRSEFDQLPHMRLTCEQAARLIGVDQATCAQALQALLALGYLKKQGQTYARTTVLAAQRVCGSDRRLSCDTLVDGTA